MEKLCCKPVCDLKKRSIPMCDQVMGLFQYLDPSLERRKYSGPSWYKNGECGNTRYHHRFSLGAHHVAGVGYVGPRESNSYESYEDPYAIPYPHCTYAYCAKRI